MGRKQDINEISVKNKLNQKQYFKISRFKEVIKRTKPHKHDGYFELIYLSEGAGFHWIDTAKIQIAPPVVYFLSGQLHYWEMTAVPKGFVLLFKEDFFDSVRDSNLVDLVQAMEGTLEIPLSENENIGFLLGEMEKEYDSPMAHSRHMIHGYLQVILAKLLSQNEDPRQTGISTNSQFKKFQQLLRSSNPIINIKVQDLADKMNISPQNLNAICRKASGRPASDLISEQVILEAKRYLLHTDKNIAEISEALKFSDPSHFIKYFKKHTAETPQHFRSDYFQ